MRCRPASRALYRTVPVGKQRQSLLRRHLRQERPVNCGVSADLSGVCPVPHRKSRQIRRAQCRRLDTLRPDNRDADHIALKLHQEIVPARSAVHLERLQGNPRIILHRREYIRRLIGE